MRGQLSLDFLLAFLLISITALNLTYLAVGEKVKAEEFDTVAKLKVFAIDVRDTVAKVHSMGGGFSIRKEYPFELKPGDRIIVILDNTTNVIKIEATINGRVYSVIQRSQVPIYEQTLVILDASHSSFWITASDEGGFTHVRVSQ
ncbi:hypothetical protein [Pyrococcus yayanosii]|uniref:Uncharacterized protein n=1 Tax=Pyrococcus yayanosii (strain CH1 / JCM 16557) TaxID=529709 RepID=F8AER5_PYRYC|nr:hypothetical protein [Pyrococcus yayanosii]AEH24747.1 hypothetical protein PYCH_10660 [Pyrococcus yayanosii CH1]